MDNRKLNHLLDRLLVIGNYQIDKENEANNIANLELLVEKLEQEKKLQEEKIDKITIIEILQN